MFSACKQRTSVESARDEPATNAASTEPVLEHNPQPGKRIYEAGIGRLDHTVFADISGSQEPSFSMIVQEPVYLTVDDIGKISSPNLEIRNGLFYEPNQFEPFSGTAHKLFDNGTLHTAFSFKNGKLHGDENRYFHNGRKGYVRRWKNGKMDGIWEEWHRNARKDFEIYFKDGVRHGKETYFSRNGREAQVRIWENGKMISDWSNYTMDETLPNSEMDARVREF